ncbi:MAG: CHAT domain-containing protein [Prochlorotrichaceae cyanobacterium]
MDEARIQAYLELIQALLNCPHDPLGTTSGQHQDLVDEGLVAVMQQVAQQVQQTPGEENTARWLDNMATQIAQAFDLGTPQPQGGTQDQAQFLLQILRLVSEQPDPQVLYPLLRQNLDQVNLGLAQALRNWAEQRLLQLNPDQQEILAGVIVNFSALIMQFPFNRGDSLEIAIVGYRLASEIFTQDRYPEQWAITQNNLAIAYSVRIRGDRAENIEQAIAAYEQALTVMTQTAMPVEWAQTLNNLANAYRNRIRGDSPEERLRLRAEDIEEAIQSYKQTLTIFEADKLPDYCRKTARLLANLYADEQRWAESLEPYQLAITAAEILYAASLFRSGQEAELKENADLYRRAAYAYAQTGDLPKAIETLEQGRARGLSETLQRDRADLDAVQQVNPALVERYQAAANALSQLESTERNLSQESNRPQFTPDELRQEAQQIRADLQACVTEIRQIPGYENFLSLPTFAEIRQAVPPDQSLVYLLVTPSGGAALVLLPSPTGRGTGGEGLIWLNDLTETKLIDFLNENWLPNDNANKRAYFEYRQNPTAETLATLQQAQQTWHETIDTTTRQLWDWGMGLVVDYLTDPVRRLSGVEGVAKSILIPTSYLGLLPLHTAWTDASEGKRHYALDTITFTPNARSLFAAQTLQQTFTADPTLLAISNPSRDLQFSVKEVQTALSTFPQGDWQLLQRNKATRTAVLEAIPHHSVLHCSCHGTANLNDPLNSGLLMADELLTLRDLFALKLQAQNQGIRLAILSACETSIPGLELPDEVVSLPIGLLQAGVAGVAASLWSVSDLSTTLLLQRFYHHWRNPDPIQRLDPPEALRQAQIWLRDTDYVEIALSLANTNPKLAQQMLLSPPQDFSQPYHWAAFTYTGV